MRQAGALLRAAGLWRGGLRRASTAPSGAFRRKARVDGVTIVATPAAAKRALKELERLKDAPHAWDTETADLQLAAGSRSQSPVCHGRVVCATCYCGGDADFGNGPRLFIDNSGPAEGLLAKYFKPYFESREYKKVFHNYHFDSHMLRRHDIHLRGFHADTLHMARLYDTSRASWEGNVKARTGWTGTSAAESRALDRPFETFGPPGGQELAPARPKERPAAAPAVTPKAIMGVRLGDKPLQRGLYSSQSLLHTMTMPLPPPEVLPGFSGDAQQDHAALRGYGLKSLATHFGLSGDAPGNFGRLFGTKATAALEAHDSPERFAEWVHYATADAVMTYGIFERLQRTLAARPWTSSVHAKTTPELLRCRQVAAELRRGIAPTYGSAQYRTDESMWNLYERYIRDLGECLADLERVGVGVDLQRLQEIQEHATQHAELCREECFKSLASVRAEDGSLLNPDAGLINERSPLQMRTLLFGGAPNLHDPSQVVEEEKEVKATSKATFKVRSLGLKPSMRMKETTKTGWPTTGAKILSDLAGDLRGGGRGSAAKEQLLRNGLREEDAEQAAYGLSKLAELRKVKHTLAGVVEPMLEFGRTTGRIHPCWEWDTSTGRLACRSPNLQNLPAVRANDSYRLRDAFRAVPGNVLVVADYSQLELRVLAHIAGCHTMIEKFKKGGDYHSECAVEMFTHVREAVSRGEVVTNEGDASGKPTVKDVFGKERGKAKAVNFGIIYGMGPNSLAETLNVDKAEARELIDLWLSTKPEVTRLKQQIERTGLRTQHSVSILGRQRHLPFLGPHDDRAPITQADQAMYRSKALRAAVNFAIQGSGADIVLAAMLQLWKDRWLQERGFKIVMQVHDEFVLEGPEEFGSEAAEVVRDVMMNPFRVYNPYFKFKVPLVVDVGVGSSFGSAKM